MNKNKYLLKKLLKWANKKQNNFNIYIAAFFQKKTKKTKKKQRKTPGYIIILHMCNKNLNDMIYSS